MTEQPSPHQQAARTEPEPLVELTTEERDRLARAPALSQFERLRLDKEAKKNWDLFYKRNGDRFFKRRFWTRHEFRELFQPTADQRYLLEVGCGCGDFALALLDDDDTPDDAPKLPENLFIYCCDLSDRAIEILKANPLYRRHNPARIEAFVADVTNELILERLGGRPVDMVSLVFVLSALDPDKMSFALDNLYQTLKPDGLVLFRDYAIYDKAMLRFSDKSKIAHQFYVRQDGTRAYFFAKEQLVELFEASNFRCQSIEYVKRDTVNNAAQVRLSRIFLQARFEKPG